MGNYYYFQSCISLCLSAHQRYECRNITYYNRARLPESHIWLQCRLSQRAQAQYKRAHHLDIVWRGCWNMHELAYCCWWWEWFVILHCIAHSNAIYPNIVQFNRALLLSKKREEDSHLQLFISRSSIHFISFSFWFFLYSLLLPPSSQICDFSKLQWKHSNPLQLRSRRSHLVYAFFLSFSLSFKNSTFHLTRNLALSTAATSRTNWKCFQNGILLSEFFFSFIHSLQPHLTLTSPFARVSNCLRVW